MFIGKVACGSFKAGRSHVVWRHIDQVAAETDPAYNTGQTGGIIAGLWQDKASPRHGVAVIAAKRIEPVLRQRPSKGKFCRINRRAGRRIIFWQIKLPGAGRQRPCNGRRIPDRNIADNADGITCVPIIGCVAEQAFGQHQRAACGASESIRCNPVLQCSIARIAPGGKFCRRHQAQLPRCFIRTNKTEAFKPAQLYMFHRCQFPVSPVPARRRT